MMSLPINLFIMLTNFDKSNLLISCFFFHINSEILLLENDPYNFTSSTAIVKRRNNILTFFSCHPTVTFTAVLGKQARKA